MIEGDSTVGEKWVKLGCVGSTNDNLDTLNGLTIGPGDITSTDELFDLAELTHLIKKEIKMEIYSATNIVLITVVSLLAYKFILPRLKISWLIGKFKNLIFKPFKKFEEDVKEEWEKSDNQTN